jgi:perosamine synthetase
MAKKSYEIGKEIRLWSTFIPPETGAEVAKTLKSTWINTGKKEARLRQEFAKKFDIKYCVATNSGTSSLRASLAALGVGPGDEVISTPYTFIATNTSILEQGAKPVFADVKYDTLNIDPASIVKKITKKTKAIMCVHYGGNPCEMDEIRKIGRDYNLPIIEDSAHAIGSKYKGHYIGEKGDIITFSLQVIKIITCGDGGMVATPNKKYYELLKKYIWFGVDRENKKTTFIDPLPERIDVLGFKYNMNDITATMALVGLKHVDEALAKRKKLGELYRRELAGLSKLKLLYLDPANTPNFQIFPVHVKNRTAFAHFMRDHGIFVNVNNRRNDRYSIFGKKQNLPTLAKVDEDTILIPIHNDLSDSDTEKIISTIKKYDKA